MMNLYGAQFQIAVLYCKVPLANKAETLHQPWQSSTLLSEEYALALAQFFTDRAAVFTS